ncbi:hypothetical protein TESG_03491 [Trichophyton tonsurans CBS 112818]|uniref:Subtilisin-like protease 10 n=1 Tax=Trichophyton tonsurans (strain CBS 112818) TaxID=647933 RepID=F2RX84_TRIT1|nr:hypothetical protein TESG_03491 [Trichophyton tonsurans CBS 112818]
MFFFKGVVAVLSFFSAVNAAPLMKPNNGTGKYIEDSYIVVLKRDISHDDYELHKRWAHDVHKRDVAKRGVSYSGIGHSWASGSSRGYSGVFSRDTIEEIMKHEHVAHVERDQIGTSQGWVTQENAPNWGLGRLSSHNPGGRDYTYDESAGGNAVVYIIDSGIDVKHPEFEGRATWGANFIDKNDVDCWSHGTHCAGIVGSLTFGVAKRAAMVAVKVLDCGGQGPYSAFVAGLHWSMEDAKNRGLIGRAIINFSLGGSNSPAVNAALEEAQRAGIFVAAAAGNFGSDAGSITPGGAGLICIVGNSDNRDYRWTGQGPSNFGPRVDIFAPGTDILSTIPGGGTGLMTGTSMASPHVAGQAAVQVSMSGFDLKAACYFFKNGATASVHNPGPNTTNKLLVNGANGNKGSEQSPNKPPGQDEQPGQNKPPGQNQPPKQPAPSPPGNPGGEPNPGGQPYPKDQPNPGDSGPSWWLPPSMSPPAWWNRRPSFGTWNHRPMWWNKPLSVWKL